MRRIFAIAVTTAALCASQLPTTAVASSGPDPSASTAKPAKAKQVRTPFALAAVAYGSRAQGGQVPANSDTTAYQQISCTNVAGRNRRNFEADLKIPGLGVAEGVSSRVWTKKRGGTVSSYSQHDIARVTIADTPLGSLQIRGLSSLSRAFNANGKFGTQVDNEIARIVLKPTGGPAQDLRIPTPGRPLVVPGLAKLEIGKSVRRASSAGASAESRVLDVTVLPGNSRVRLAHTSAQISTGVERGVFKGYSAGIQARGLDDNLRAGRTPLVLMPCQGTKGKTRAKDLARVNLADQVVARGVGASQVSTNRAAVARGTETGRVARAELADGRVVLNAIRGQVNVKRTRSGVTSNIKGTRVGEIVVDGESYSLPAVGALEIPGLVKIEDAIRTRTPNGLKVVGLRVTLLDGTGAVVDLGVAQLAIRPGAPRR